MDGWCVGGVHLSVSAPHPFISFPLGNFSVSLHFSLQFDAHFPPFNARPASTLRVLTEVRHHLRLSLSSNKVVIIRVRFVASLATFALSETFKK